MSKSTIQRQKLIADLIEEGKITSQNQLKGILKNKVSQLRKPPYLETLQKLEQVKKEIQKII